MKKFLYIIGVAALLFARACTREPIQKEQAPAVAVSMQLDVAPFGTDGQVLTKAEFEDPVDANIHYDYEKQLNGLNLYLFDASDAFETGSFKSADTKYIGKASPLHIEAAGTAYRADFFLSEEYDALAVVALANYPATAFSSLSISAGQSMDDFAGQLENLTLDFVADQSTYASSGIPVHGWKVFGTKASPLKYYKGISTLISGSESLTLNYALVRLQLRYLPETGQVPASQVDVESVKLTGYMGKYRAVPRNWFSTAALPTPFDAVEDAGSYGMNELTFTSVNYKEQPSATETLSARVAYVPEMSVATVNAAVAADPVNVKEPALAVVMKKYEVDASDVRTGEWTKFTYSTDGVTMEDSASTPASVTYVNPGWTDWLQLRTVYGRKDKEGNDVAVGTRFNLVRHYSYEWKATGIDK